MSDLKSDLTEISGVGEKTADKILALVDDESDAKLEKAKAAARNGDDRECRIWLQRWMNE